MLQRPSAKLRQSCDDCLSAKVKCEKQKPTCERCLKANKTCVYSLSRKTGRPSSLAVRQRSEMSAPRTPQAYLAPKASGDGLCPDSLFDWVADGPDSNWDDFAMEKLDPLLWLPPSSDTLVDPDQPDLTMEPPQHQHQHRPSLQSSDSASYSDAETLADDSCPAFNLLGKCHFGNLPTPLDGVIHGCDHEACSVLGSLNCAEQITTGALAPFESCWDTIFRLDNILQRNKSAASKVTQLLDCSCAQEPHLAMLYASIVSRIIAWYQVAARQLLMPQSTSSSSLSSDCDMTGVQPTSTGIRMGSFEPDYLDQAALHRQLLLIEVSKVDGVIDKMLATSRQQCQSGKDINITVRWYDLACLSAKAKLQETKDLVNEVMGANHL